jgi:hypothetical protein
MSSLRMVLRLKVTSTKSINEGFSVDVPMWFRPRLFYLAFPSPVSKARYKAALLSVPFEITAGSTHSTLII